MTKTTRVHVNGLTRVRQTAEVAAIFKPHRVGVGFNINRQSLVQPRHTNHQNDRFPHITGISDLILNADWLKHSLNVFADTTWGLMAEEFEPIWTSDPRIKRITLHSGDWPKTSTLEVFKKQRPGVEMVMGVNHRMMRHDNGPEIAWKLHGYEHLIDGVILGSGDQHLDANTIAGVIAAVRHVSPGLNIGVAGKISEEMIRTTTELLQEHPELEIHGDLASSASEMTTTRWMAGVKKLVENVA